MYADELFLNVFENEVCLCYVTSLLLMSWHTFATREFNVLEQRDEQLQTHV